jgi:hypothetical protein
VDRGNRHLVFVFLSKGGVREESKNTCRQNPDADGRWPCAGHSAVLVRRGGVQLFDQAKSCGDLHHDALNTPLSAAADNRNLAMRLAVTTKSSPRSSIDTIEKQLKKINKRNSNSIWSKLTDKPKFGLAPRQ